MASIEGTKQFLGELDKVQKRLNEAQLSANNVAREKFNLDMSLAQNGLASRVDPQTGQQFIEKMSPEQNQVLQGKIANMDALASAQQDISNNLRKQQVVADLDLTGSPEAAQLRQAQRGIKREEALDKTGTQAEVLRSKAGKAVQAQEVEQTGALSKARSKGTELGKLEAAIDPTFRQAKTANDLLKIQEQQSSLNILERMNPNLDISVFREELEKGNLIDPKTIAQITNQTIIRNSIKSRDQDVVDRLLTDVQALAESAGIDLATLPFTRDSSPDVIKAAIKSIITTKPKGVSLPEFNKFNDNVNEVSKTFDDLRSVQLFVKQVEGAPGLVFNSKDIPDKIKNLFPEILKDVTAVDSDDTAFSALKGELEGLKSDYTILANSLRERAKRNTEFKSKFNDLVNSGIILGKKVE